MFVCVFLFSKSTEAWTILLGLITQELPCFILRVYALSKLGFFNNSSIYFFAFKNALMILIYTYKLIVEYFEFRTIRKSIKIIVDEQQQQQQKKREKKDNDDDDDEKIDMRQSDIPKMDE